MRVSVKRNIRETTALKQIEKGLVLDRKLLRQQINTLSKLTAITNNGIGDALVGSICVLEIFEWLRRRNTGYVQVSTGSL